MNCFDQVDLNMKNGFHRSKQDHHSKERLAQQRKDNKFDDNLSMKSHEDDDGSLSSYQSTTSANSQDPSLSQHSSRSVLDLPNQKTKSKFSLIYIQMHINILLRT